MARRRTQKKVRNHVHKLTILRGHKVEPNQKKQLSKEACKKPLKDVDHVDS
jgi:hypothetical protein